MTQGLNFKSIPITEHPKEEGWYLVLMKTGKVAPWQKYYNGERWLKLRPDLIHYLLPVPSSVVVNVESMESVIEILKECSERVPEFLAERIQSLLTRINQ